MKILVWVGKGALLVVSVILGYMVVDEIQTTIEEKKALERHVRIVKERMEYIGKAQKAFKTTNGQFAANWNTLISFVKTDSMPVVISREREVAQDSFVVTSDSILVSVRDSLFKNTPFAIDSMYYGPNPEGGWSKFELEADSTERRGIPLYVFEVTETTPMIEKRRVKLGSLQSPSYAIKEEGD